MFQNIDPFLEDLHIGTIDYQWWQEDDLVNPAKKDCDTIRTKLLCVVLKVKNNYQN